MKHSLRILGLFCIATLAILYIQADTSAAYKITGALITLEPETSEEETAQSDDDTSAETTAPEMPAYEAADLSNATLTMSYETTNAEGETETVTLYEGPYQENFTNVSQVTEPTKVKISLLVTEDGDPMTINTVIGNGSDVQFAYIDRPGPRDQFLLVGASNQVMNPENKFSVSGDLSFLDIDLKNTTSVEVYGIVYDDQGEFQAKQFGPVLVKNNSFQIEGDVDRPFTARLYVNDSNEYFSSTELIVEPQGDIVVSQLGSQTQELSVVNGSGFHAMLVESWQQSSKYISLVEAYAAEYVQYLKRWEAGEPEPESSDEEDSEVADSDTEESSNSGDDTEQLTAAEGCEDAVAQESDSAESSYSRPQYYTLQLKAKDIRNDVLKEIAEGDGDPMARYLAIDMNPYHWSDYASQLAAIQPLVEELDEQFVASNIEPKIERLERGVILVKNDAALIPGQKVPSFALANYDGDEVELYDLLGENDLVLIDFWASWCGPCIADFPELKNLHSAYTDEDFEIVGVSIDSTMEDWIGGVDEHDLPWINLGEVKGWEGPVSTMYGVDAIPKGFLVDSQGCIYKKNIRPAALKEFLVDRYGMDESLIEPEEETEDTPDVSS